MGVGAPPFVEPILVVGLGCSQGVRDFDPWPVVLSNFEASLSIPARTLCKARGRLLLGGLFWTAWLILRKAHRRHAEGVRAWVALLQWSSGTTSTCNLICCACAAQSCIHCLPTPCMAINTSKVSEKESESPSEQTQQDVCINLLAAIPHQR